MQYSIRIPDPCSESWNEMTPISNGRHCDQCSNTVVDFTAWSNSEIQEYLQQQRTNRVCGRFRNEQLTNVDNDTFFYSVTSSSAPFYSKLAAIFLLAFGLIQMSCSTDNHNNAPVKQTTVSTDTLQKETNPVTIDKAIAAPPEDKRYLTGEVEIIHIDSAKHKTNPK